MHKIGRALVSFVSFKCGHTVSFSFEVAEPNYCASLGNLHDTRNYIRLDLELADLGVKGEGVEEHGADESDVGRLAEKKCCC